MAPTSKQRYLFGEFVLIPTDNQFFVSGSREELEPKVFDLLSLLVVNHGNLVTYETISAKLWPDVSVSTQAPNVLMVGIRKILGDDPNNPSFIKTEYKRGFRFIHDVEIENDSEAKSAPEIHENLLPETEASEPASEREEQVAGANKSTSLLKRATFAVLIFVAIVAGAGYILWQPSTAGQRLEGRLEGVDELWKIADIESVDGFIPHCSERIITGIVEPNGERTLAWFEWGETRDLGNVTLRRGINEVTLHMEHLVNLKENTTYFYRLVVENVNGMAGGRVGSFTTARCD